MEREMENLNELFKNYCDDRETYGKDKTLDNTKDFYKNNIEKKLGKRKANRITNEDARTLFKKITQEGYLHKANKFLKVLGAILNSAIEHQKLEHNIISGIKRHAEFPRERYLKPDELKRVYEILNEKAKNPICKQGACFIKLLIQTGARRGEIAKATFNDLKGNHIVLTKHKTDHKKKERKIFLNASALAIIDDLGKKEGDEKIVGINDPTRLWHSVREEAGVPDATLHTLRHTFASYALKSKKVSLEEIGNLLGHESLQSTQRYSHFAEETSIENAEIVGQEIFKSIN
jgi:integrase